jgi:glycosyltransferase involved in cell wall biosynthesis
MRIGIDISQVIYGTGVSVYTKELVKNLLAIDQENEYVLFGGSLRAQFLLRQFTLSLKGNFETKILPISPRTADFIWNRVHRLKIEKLLGKIDVFHASDWSQPPTRAFKVTTVHDLSPFLYPNLTPKKIVSAHSRRMYWVLREADRIIVPSNSTKEELIKLGGREEKIRVIYEGVSEEFKVSSTKPKIKDDYILTVGSGGRKNTDKLIEAYEKIKRKNLKLVIAGHVDPKYIDRRGVIPIGRVSDQELANLYSHAKALIYPSIYEGFGLFKGLVLVSQ